MLNRTQKSPEWMRQTHLVELIMAINERHPLPLTKLSVIKSLAP